MKKSEPKIILNLNLEGQELEQKIKIAIDDYVEKVILNNLDEAIATIIAKRIEAIAKRNYNDGYVNGMYLDAYVRSKTKELIEKSIDSNIKEIMSKKLSQMI